MTNFGWGTHLIGLCGIVSPSGEPYRATHRTRPGQQTITVTVPRKPTSAGIDPLFPVPSSDRPGRRRTENLLIDLDTENNSKGVKIEN